MAARSAIRCTPIMVTGPHTLAGCPCCKGTSTNTDTEEYSCCSSASSREVPASSCAERGGGHCRLSMQHVGRAHHNTAVTPADCPTVCNLNGVERRRYGSVKQGVAPTHLQALLFAPPASYWGKRSRSRSGLRTSEISDTAQSSTLTGSVSRSFDRRFLNATPGH